MRPIDLEYAENPDKRKKDFEELKRLIKTIIPLFETTEKDYKSGFKEPAIDGFILVASNAINLLYLYEALGYSFKNKKLGYPHYLIYKLEAILEERKDVVENGVLVNKPTNPNGSQILMLTGKQKDEIVYSELSSDEIYSSAKRIVEWLQEMLLSQKKVFER